MYLSNRKPGFVISMWDVLQLNPNFGGYDAKLRACIILIKFCLKDKSRHFFDISPQISYLWESDNKTLF